MRWMVLSPSSVGSPMIARVAAPPMTVPATPAIATTSANGRTATSLDPRTRLRRGSASRVGVIVRWRNSPVTLSAPRIAGKM